MNPTRKVRFVAGGLLTEPPASITYLSVVSCDGVQLARLLAAFKDLDIVTHVAFATHILMHHVERRSGLLPDRSLDRDKAR